MEQHRTRPPNDGPRRGTPPQSPLPPQARHRPGDGHGAGGRRSAPRAGRAARQARGSGPPRERWASGTPWEGRPGPAGRRLPNPRLTGLGSGLFCMAAMFLLGCLDQLLFGASPTVYCVLFLPVCVLTALWVRGGDVLTAPVVLPIAFAVGLLPVAESGGGLLGRAMGLVTVLATQAGWLYGGTLVAGVIVLARRVLWVRARRHQ
ncbi:DUF6542 domain-containing protein [Streptomyces sp. Caat 7-52]|uniref:DUF6542 domain-containing protein n=1 Tax=Streptomyces sp. Caat 7-52 TaxID=2949637 RepID=UPI002034D9F1|nr:DUF6542 domain-containing protein [Streptomyces sp. Caat 7-52]